LNQEKKQALQIFITFLSTLPPLIFRKKLLQVADDKGYTDFDLNLVHPVLTAGLMASSGVATYNILEKLLYKSE